MRQAPPTYDYANEKYPASDADWPAAAASENGQQHSMACVRCRKPSVYISGCSRPFKSIRVDRTLNDCCWKLWRKRLGCTSSANKGKLLCVVSVVPGPAGVRLP